MEFGVGAYGFGLLAGVLSTLSPCVLPILPIVLASATNAHPRAPLALAGGLALSYAIIGTGLAWAGSALDLDTSVFRNAGAVILGLLGLVLVSGALQQRFAQATSGIADAGNALLARLDIGGLWGQFAVGLTLGVVWSPCVGPTLGAATVLASQGSHVLQVALLMGVFGLGAALPLLALAYVGRSAMMTMRDRLMRAGKAGKTLLGIALIAVAVMILSGADKPVETWLVDVSPDWLTRLTTRF